MALHWIVKNKLIIFMACFTAVGCSATNTAKNNEQPLNNEIVTISAAELAELKESAAQWQQAKPGLERLLAIEQDLKLLITQLNAVVEQKSSARQMQPATAPTSAFQPQTNVQPLYALQVASVTEQARLAKSITSIRAKAPELFSGELITNVEAAQVNGDTYYRLKIGAYQDEKNATKACAKLKQHQVSCLVSYYTDNPL